MVAALSLLALGCAPASGKADPDQQLYAANAREARDYLNDHPISRLLSTLFVHRIEVTDYRVVPGSCAGGTDAALPHMTDVVATVTDYSFGFIPVERYESSCAGLSISRGRITPAPPADNPARNPPSAGPAPPPPRPPAA